MFLTFIFLSLFPPSPLSLKIQQACPWVGEKRKISCPNVPIWLRKIVSWIPDTGVSSSSIKNRLHITHTDSSVRDTHRNYFKHTRWKNRLDVIGIEVCQCPIWQRSCSLVTDSTVFHWRPSRSSPGHTARAQRGEGNVCSLLMADDQRQGGPGSDSDSVKANIDYLLV